MSLALIITLIVIGLLLLILEVLVIPGTTVVGILGGATVCFSLYQVFAVYGTVEGVIATCIVLAASIALIVISLRSKTWKSFMLNTELQTKVNTIDHMKIKVGDKGESISRLAPMGKANFNDEYYEVESDEGYIEENSKIKVVKINGSKIMVSRVKENDDKTA